MDAGGHNPDPRLAALRIGSWLGWLSIAAVLGGLALGLPAHHRPAVIVLSAVAAVANAGAMAAPWRRWLDAGAGPAAIDLWSSGLIGFVALLVLVAGARADFDLLLFLVVPFLATVHEGTRRLAWPAAAGAAYVAIMVAAPASLPEGQVVLRLALLAAAAMLAFALAAIIRREASALARASERAELERALLAEAHHRVKNSLQTVADILLLSRPQGASGRAFDETAERIRAIAAVHRLIAGGGGGEVEARELLSAVIGAASAEVRLDADDVRLGPATAQQLGVVANELITNAVQHGRPPIEVAVRGGEHMVLTVRDAGEGPDGHPGRLGLQLVRQVVERSLGGTFTLGREAGMTQARVEVPAGEHAHPDR